MNLTQIIEFQDVLAGGPGSGCRGDNCGRPPGPGHPEDHSNVGGKKRKAPPKGAPGSAQRGKWEKWRRREMSRLTRRANKIGVGFTDTGSLKRKEVKELAQKTNALIPMKQKGLTFVQREKERVVTTKLLPRATPKLDQARDKHSAAKLAREMFKEAATTKHGQFQNEWPAETQQQYQKLVNREKRTGKEAEKIQKNTRQRSTRQEIKVLKKDVPKHPTVRMGKKYYERKENLNQPHRSKGKFSEAMNVHEKTSQREHWQFETPVKGTTGKGSVVILNKEKNAAGKIEYYAHEVEITDYANITTTKNMKFKSYAKAVQVLKNRYGIKIAPK